MKKLILIILILIAVFGGIFLYMTSPVLPPSGNIAVNNAPQQPTSYSQVFVINPARSEARFEINEVLRGEPFRVVGLTSAVAGEITINPLDPKTSSISTISINARTLKTDSQMRNGAIGRMILKSEEHEFITFTPANTTGFPEKPEIGVEYSFQVTGTLTIVGVPKEATFSVKAKAVSENEIAGSATTTINYKDFSISIPEVPFVASVEDNVDLVFTFVAEKK